MFARVARDDVFAARYAERRRQRGILHFGLLRRTELVARHIADGAAVLDIGAADGVMLDALSQRKRLGLAVNLERHRDLAMTIRRNGVCGDAVRLPFQDETFDCVVCSATRKHVADSLTLASEIARVLKQGGVAIVVDPHPWVLRLGSRIGKFDPRCLRHVSTAQEIGAELGRFGLREKSLSNRLFVSCVAQKF